MYLIGAPHPHKTDAHATLERLIAAGQRLVADAEVLQEILHRYAAIDKTPFTKEFDYFLARNAMKSKHIPGDTPDFLSRNCSPPCYKKLGCSATPKPDPANPATPPPNSNPIHEPHRPAPRKCRNEPNPVGTPRTKTHLITKQTQLACRSPRHRKMKERTKSGPATHTKTPPHYEANPTPSPLATTRK